MPTVIVEHGLHVKEIPCARAVLELLNLVVDELPEVLEVEERCQKLLHLRSRREEPAASTTTHRPIPHVPIHMCTTNNTFIMHLFSVCVHKQQMSRVRHSIYLHTTMCMYVSYLCSLLDLRFLIKHDFSFSLHKDICMYIIMYVLGIGMNST